MIYIDLHQPTKTKGSAILPVAGPFCLDLILNTHLEGAVLSPEHLLAMLDELGADHPDFQRAYAAHEAAEQASRTDHAAEVANRNVLRRIIEQDELELALTTSHTPLAPFPAPRAAKPQKTPSTLLPVPSRGLSRAIPKPCPAIAKVTMIQTTLWDNWGSEKRPKTGGYKDRVPMNRFGCDIEVWTDAGATIVNIADLRKKLAFRSRTDLIRWQDFAPIPDKLEADGKITRAYADELLALHAASAPTISFGLFSGKGAAKGSKSGGGYIPRTFARVEMIGPMPGAGELWVDGQSLTIDGWTSRTPSGDPLAAYRASRMDIEGSYGWKGWDSRA